MANTPRPIDMDLVERLSVIHCTEAEIALAIGMTPEGFRKRKQRDEALVGALEKGRAAGRRSLRRLQWEAAQRGNIVAQIWLGKQLLGQRDVPLETPPFSEEPTFFAALQRAPGGLQLLTEMAPLFGRAMQLLGGPEAGGPEPAVTVIGEDDAPLALPDPEPQERG